MTAPTAPPPGPSPAEVRHRIENLLARYTEAVDARDVAAVAALLADALVTFDAGTPLHGPAIAEAYEKTFGAGGSTRHLLFTGHVEYEPGTGVATVRVPYQRWSLDDGAPQLSALGWIDAAFSLDQAGGSWRQHHVRRDWQIT